MPDQCKQEKPIALLEERSKNQQKALDEMAGAMKENNELLKQVAQVLSEIKHLHEDSKRNEKAINALFDRVRQVELRPDFADVVGRLESMINGLADKDSVRALAKKVDDLEKQPGRNASKAWWVIFGVLAGSAGSVVTGLILVFARWVITQ